MSGCKDVVVVATSDIDYWLTIMGYEGNVSVLATNGAIVTMDVDIVVGSLGSGVYGEVFEYGDEKWVLFVVDESVSSKCKALPNVSIVPNDNGRLGVYVGNNRIHDDLSVVRPKDDGDVEWLLDNGVTLWIPVFNYCLKQLPALNTAWVKEYLLKYLGVGE